MAFKPEHPMNEFVRSQQRLNDQQIEINNQFAGVVREIGAAGLQTKRTVIALIGYLRDNGGITLDQAAELHRLLYEDMSK